MDKDLARPSLSPNLGRTSARDFVNLSTELCLFSFLSHISFAEEGKSGFLVGIAPEGKEWRWVWFGKFIHISRGVIWEICFPSAMSIGRKAPWEPPPTRSSNCYFSTEDPLWRGFFLAVLKPPAFHEGKWFFFCRMFRPAVWVQERSRICLLEQVVVSYREGRLELTITPISKAEIVKWFVPCQ